MVKIRFSIPLASLFVRHHFDSNTKRNIDEMHSYVKKGFLKLIKQADWLDKETQNFALGKLQKMDSLIGYPKILLDTTFIEKLYEDYPTDYTYYDAVQERENNMTSHHLNSSAVLHDGELERISSHLLEVNAEYDILANQIEVLAGILQPNFYIKGRMSYLNYGAAGAIIGHEITHAFDNSRHRLDENARDDSNWGQDAEDEYQRRSKCLENQYSNFTEPITQLHLNGTKTRDEDIADHGGLRAAYIAYNRWALENGVEPRLPGLDLNNDQLFWTSWANNWCGVFTEQDIRDDVDYNFHSPSRFRVNGPLMNIDEFADHFNCPLGSPMNPVNKCRVW